MNITAVIPVYNESHQTLSSVLDKLKNYVDQIVVVDDGSTNKLKLTDRQVISLYHQINRGQGAALQTGTDYAVGHGADIIVHFDGDGQHRAQDIPDLIRPILDGRADFVFGSRFLFVSTSAAQCSFKFKFS